MKEHTLRERCSDCGAKVKYVVDFRRKWSWCTGCAPVYDIDLEKLYAGMRGALNPDAGDKID